MPFRAFSVFCRTLMNIVRISSSSPKSESCNLADSSGPSCNGCPPRTSAGNTNSSAQGLTRELIDEPITAVNFRLCLGEICVAATRSTIFATEQHRASGDSYRNFTRAPAVRIPSLRALCGNSRVIPVRHCEPRADVLMHHLCTSRSLICMHIL